MALVTGILSCPKCEYNILNPKDGECPSCGYDLGFDHLDPLEKNKIIAPGSISKGETTTPYSLHEQAQRHQDNDMPILMAALALNPNKAKGIVLDAYLIIKSIAVKKASETDIREILGYAISIGEMAKAYQSFLDSGGKHVPDLIGGNHAESGTKT